MRYLNQPCHFLLIMEVRKKYNNLGKIPKPVHFWEVDGFVRLSDEVRNKFEKLIKTYGVRRLAEDLKFDRETIYSIYTGKKFIHSVSHLIKIAEKLNYDLRKLEKEIIAYGGKQTRMYDFSFPFTSTPLHIRAIAIHGDGSYNKVTGKTEYYQQHKHISYMVKLLNKIFKYEAIKTRRKNEVMSYVTIPSILVKLVCKSIDLHINEFHSERFFNKII